MGAWIHSHDLAALLLGFWKATAAVAIGVVRPWPLPALAARPRGAPSCRSRTGGAGHADSSSGAVAVYWLLLPELLR